MNGSGTGSPPLSGEIGSQMKAFLLLVFLFIGFLFLSASGSGAVDLTPDTAPVNAAAAPAQGDVIVIPDSVVVSNVEQAVPVTGTCTDPYIVSPGDMLSSIAQICNTSVANIRLANPEILNANLIYPGQVIRISANTALLPTTIPITGQQPAPVLPTAQPVVVTPEVAIITQGQPTAPAVASSPQLVPAILPGTGMQVKGFNFPVNTPVHIAIGPLNTGYNVVATGITDAAGNIIITIVVPSAPDPTLLWIVVVATVDEPVVQAASKPFTILSSP